MNRSFRVKCPDCKGEGRVTVVEQQPHYILGSMDPVMVPYDYGRTCTNCRGSGEVTVELDDAESP